jgi:hypothetical protein
MTPVLLSLVVARKGNWCLSEATGLLAAGAAIRCTAIVSPTYAEIRAVPSPERSSQLVGLFVYELWTTGTMRSLAQQPE